MTKAELIALVDQRDKLDAQIQEGMKTLDLDAKGLKAIRRAVADAEAAKNTLAALMGEGLIADPQTLAPPADPE